MKTTPKKVVKEKKIKFGAAEIASKLVNDSSLKSLNLSKSDLELLFDKFNTEILRILETEVGSIVKLKFGNFFSRIKPESFVNMVIGQTGGDKAKKKKVPAHVVLGFKVSAAIRTKLKEAGIPKSKETTHKKS